MTRGQVKAGGREEAHPGLDIAVPVGSLVRASGGATVRAGRVKIPNTAASSCSSIRDEYQTMYGHLSRILVTLGHTVTAGRGDRAERQQRPVHAPRTFTSRSASRASRSIR